MLQVYNYKELAKFLTEHCVPKFATLLEQPKSKPYVIGITGTNSAVGKSSIGNLMSDLLSEYNSQFINLDDWINVSRAKRKSIYLSGISPNAWDINGLINSLNNLIFEKSEIYKPTYDHVAGIAKAKEDKINSSDIIILAGGACLWDEIRPFINYIVCIQTDSVKSEMEMTIERNTAIRNYSNEDALEEYYLTKKAYNKYVIPFRKYSDIIVEVDSSYNFHIIHIQD